MYKKREISFGANSLRCGSCLTFRTVCSPVRHVGISDGPYGGHCDWE